MIHIVNSNRSEDISGARQLLEHSPSKGLQSLQLVIIPYPGHDYFYPSSDLGELDEALVTAAADVWRDVHFSFAVYAAVDMADVAMRRLREKACPLLNAKLPLDITVVRGARFFMCDFELEIINDSTRYKTSFLTLTRGRSLCLTSPALVVIRLVVHGTPCVVRRRLQHLWP